MIKISVDEGVAFDMLSILQVKSTHNEGARKAFRRLREELEVELIESLYNEIVASPIYLDLYSTNLDLFRLIDDLKLRGEQVGDATKVDSLNYSRYKLKTQLQARFFPDKPITEVKLGYDK